MHSKDVRAEGEAEQRLYGLNVWREAPFYTDRERAALEWTEAVTLVSRDQVPNEVYAETRRHFNESELACLTMAVVAINGWNRIAIAFRAVAGSYQPPAEPIAWFTASSLWARLHKSVVELRSTVQPEARIHMPGTPLPLEYNPVWRCCTAESSE